MSATEPHVVTIKHDAESHVYHCHDDCTAVVTCPGVTNACRCWLECTTCRDATAGLDDEARGDYDERLYDQQEAHGEEHQRIDGMWMTPTDHCLSQELDTDADELVYTLDEGEHPVDVNCEESFVYVRPVGGAS